MAVLRHAAAGDGRPFSQQHRAWPDDTGKRHSAHRVRCLAGTGNREDLLSAHGEPADGHRPSNRCLAADGAPITPGNAAALNNCLFGIKRSHRAGRHQQQKHSRAGTQRSHPEFCSLPIDDCEGRRDPVSLWRQGARDRSRPGHAGSTGAWAHSSGRGQRRRCAELDSSLRHSEDRRPGNERPHERQHPDRC